MIETKIIIHWNEKESIEDQHYTLETVKAVLEDARNKNLLGFKTVTRSVKGR